MSILAFSSNSILDATAAGKSLLTAANAAAQRSLLGLGTLATQNGNIADYLTVASAAASYQPLDSDLTAIAALSTTAFGRALLEQVDAAAVRSYIGAGTSSFDGTFASLTGKPTTLLGYGITDAQPLDSDLTAIAGLSTTVFGRSLLTETNAASARTTLGLGTLATQTGNISDYLTIASAASSYQPLDSDLTAIAAVATQSFGRNLLAETSASTLRTTLGLGTGDGPSFTTLTLAGQSLTGAGFKSLMDLSTTWNTTAAPTAIKLNITDTASAVSGLTSAFSILIDGAARMLFHKASPIYGSVWSLLFPSPSVLFDNGVVLNPWGPILGATATLQWANGLVNETSYSTTDLVLARDAANTLAQRNGLTAQAFRVYNTFTNASNYERGKFAWESNILRIGTEKAGTGSARALELQTDGTTRLTVGTTGNVGIGISPSTLLEIAGSNGSNTIRSTTTSNLGSTAWAGVIAHDIQFQNNDPSGSGIYSAIRVIGSADSGAVHGGTANYDFTVWTGGYLNTLTERFRVTANGELGIGTSSPTERLQITGGKTMLAASTTSKASLNVPSGTAPSSPTDGDIWFDGTNFKVRVGGVTKTIMFTEDYDNLYIRP